MHTWTFAEPDSTLAGYRRYLAMGMDGMFSNYADQAVQARDAYTAARR